MAAKKANTEFILYAHDDFYFCPKWDLVLKSELDKIKHKNFYLSGTMVNNGQITLDCGSNLETFDEKKLLSKISDANFWLGGAYGEGGLLIGDAIVGYFNMAQASIGLKIGIQDYSLALFFMNSSSLTNFRSSDGWSLGVDAEYVLAKDSGRIGRDVSTSKTSTDVIALMFDRSGITFGGSLEGVKYTPIYKN